MVQISNRDRDFIVNRLYAPATDVLDVIDRLRTLGFMAEADELMDVVQVFTDSVRATRRSFTDKLNSG